MNTRRRQRTTDLLYSTWKVQTLLQPGKMMEIADEVLKQGIDLVALQEIRWQGHGEINKKNFTVIYGVSQEECARLRESVPYVKLYRYNPKHLCPK